MRQTNAMARTAFARRRSEGARARCMRASLLARYARRRLSLLRMLARLLPLVRSPLAWIVLLAGLVRVVGIGWGLPASDGWDNDGIAPRDFLAGIVETFTPGHYFTYPPVHLVLLAILTAPITIVALVRAPSLAPADVVHEIVKVPYM